MSLSRRTVTTITGKLDGSDRTSNQRRMRLGLEPKRKDWRPTAMARLPKQAGKLPEKGRELGEGRAEAAPGKPVERPQASAMPERRPQCGKRLPGPVARL
jgi:hypothetical protein